jgi:hypothetical protein
MAWGIVYFKAKDGRVLVEDFLDGCPAKIEARFYAVLEAVRDAPPPQFSGGGYWEAMHGDMGGFHEIRLTGPGRRQYRLFCILDNADPDGLRKRGFDRPQIAVVAGMVKDSGKKFSDRDYAKVRALGDQYLKEPPVDCFLTPRAPECRGSRSSARRSAINSSERLRPGARSANRPRISSAACRRRSTSERAGLVARALPSRYRPLQKPRAPWE